MDRFPFTSAEWSNVEDAARTVVNASAAGDAALEASQFIGLVELLHSLRTRYGEHPVLIETEADFTTDAAERQRLYRHATMIALAHRLPTLSIRLSLAQSLIDSNEMAAARVELKACEDEMRTGEPADRDTWAALFQRTAP